MRLIPLACLLLTTAVATQVAWTEHVLFGRAAGPAAFDVARGRLVTLVASSAYPVAMETWEWDGAAWHRRASATSPPFRSDHALVYDAARQRVLLFGGGSNLDDTWEWDGSAWTQRTPAIKPPPRYGARLAFDSVRQRVVLFGGAISDFHGRAFYDDTWEWDGSVWTQRTARGPDARMDHAMTFDAVRQRVVLHGGWSAFAALGDTWTFDGAAWTRHSSGPAPSARGHAGMTFDATRARVVLFGGSGPGTLEDTWEWDGTAWLRASPSTSPSAREQTALVFDSGRGTVLGFSGVDYVTGPLGDLWQWDGAAWSLTAPAEAPPAMSEPAAAFDSERARLVVFGGNGYGNPSQHWEWDGSRWTRFTGPQPPATSRAAMVYDRRDGYCLLFGGAQPSFSNETWTFDGANWRQRSPATRPYRRVDHALAFDSRRRRAVLFGGFGDRGPFSELLGDTWEWNGSTWIELRLTMAPPPRSGHAMAYDEARGVVVLFGGMGPLFRRLNDTWEWNGMNWALRATPIAPPGYSEHAMTYDGARRRVVLFLGSASNQTWEWDGNAWMQRATAAAPPARCRHTLAYDDARDRVLMFGGQGQALPGHVDLWEYAPVVPATVTSLGTSCPGPDGPPMLAPDRGARPWLGEVFVLTVAPIPSTGATLMWLGASTTSWLGIPLPVGLGSLGMTGCTLYTSIEVTALASNRGGMAELALPLPLNPALLGAALAMQSAVFDPDANLAGVIATNALRLRLGAK